MRFSSLGVVLLLITGAIVRYANAQCPTGNYTGGITISGNCTISTNLTVTGNVTISNSATLTVNPGVVLTVTGDLQSAYMGGAITVNGGGTINVGGRFYNQVRTSTSFTFSNITVTVNNSGSTTVFNDYTSSLNLLNGTVFTVVQGGFENDVQTVLTVDNSVLNITSGNFLNDFQADLYVQNGGAINVNNGNFQTENESYLLIDNSDVYVNGDMNNDYHASLDVQNGGTLTVTGNFNNGQDASGAGVTAGYINVDGGGISVGGNLNNDYGSDINVGGGGSFAVVGDVDNEQAATIDVGEGTFSYGGTINDPNGGVSSSSDDSECSDGCCGSGCVPLPVKLLALRAEIRSAYAHLTWQTATEINNEFFTIEKSKDGRSFIPVGKVAGSGNTKQVINYTWNDPVTISGLTYYRLSQTDFDGTTEVLGLRSLSPPSKEMRISFRPNPIQSEGVLGIDGGAPQRVLIYSPVGQLLYDLQPASADVQLPELQAGMYLIKVSFEGFTISDRLLVKGPGLRD